MKSESKIKLYFIIIAILGYLGLLFFLDYLNNAILIPGILIPTFYLLIGLKAKSKNKFFKASRIVLSGILILYIIYAIFSALIKNPASLFHNPLLLVTIIIFGVLGVLSFLESIKK